MEGVNVITSGILELTVSSSITSFTNIKRFEKSLTIDDIKSKLELITGIPAGSMRLEVYTEDNKLVSTLMEGSALLGSYHIDDGMRLHAIDTEKNRKLGEYEDVSKVEKFELDDEAYSKKRDSVRAFMKKNKMGKYNPEEQELARKQEEERVKFEEQEKKRIQVGMRCEVTIPKQLTKRGTVRYVGDVDFKPHLWIGVEYDEPMGKNNGTVQGRTYFECQDKYGAFVRSKQVEVGDFPELGLGSDDDEM